MSTHANRVKMTVTSVASSGTGDITLNAASSGFRSFATAYGANATADILITEGTAWEIARNCTYTHSGTTVSRGTLENSSTGSAVAFTSAAVVSVIATADAGRRWDSAGLQTGAVETVTSSNVTGVVGKMHRLDIDGMTAARDFVLPTTAATDDRIGVFCTTDAPTTSAYVLQIKSGAAGDLINGTDHSSTIWSSLLIKSECLIFRCIDGSTVDWIVEYDGRIQQQATISSTGVSMTSAATVRLTSAQWTVDSNIGGIYITTGTNPAFNARRAGKYVCQASGGSPTLADAKYWYVRLESAPNGTPANLVDARALASGPDRLYLNATKPQIMAVGDEVGPHYNHNGTTGTSVNLVASILEIL